MDPPPPSYESLMRPQDSGSKALSEIPHDSVKQVPPKCHYDSGPLVPSACPSASGPMVPSAIPYDSDKLVPSTSHHASAPMVPSTSHHASAPMVPSVSHYDSGPLVPSAPPAGCVASGDAESGSATMVNTSTQEVPPPNELATSSSVIVDVEIEGDDGLEEDHPPIQVDAVLEGEYFGQTCSVVLHVLFFACVIATVILRLFHEFIGAIVAGVAAVVVYIIILIHAMRSNTREYLNNIEEFQGIKTYTEEMKALEPKIWMAVECYHHEMRTVHHSDGTYDMIDVKVVTHREWEPLHYSHWRDVSEEIIGVHPDKPTKLLCSIHFRFKDDVTRKAVYKQFAAFKEKNRGRDAYMSARLRFMVPAFKTRMTAFWDNRRTSCLYTSGCFCCFVLMLMSVCYRRWFSQTVPKLHFRCIKEISI